MALSQLCEVGSVLPRLAAHEQTPVGVFLPRVSLQGLPANSLGGQVVFSNDDIKAAMQLQSENPTTQIWIVNASSPVAFKLYPLKTFGDPLKFWELIRSDQGFWSHAKHAPSMQLGALSWPWLLGRVTSVKVMKNDHYSPPWARASSNGGLQAIYNNVLLCIAVGDTDGRGTFRVFSNTLTFGAKTDCWELASSVEPSLTASSHDVVVLCKEELRKHAIVKSACERSSRRWGPDGMVKLRVSGIDKAARDQLSESALVSSSVGEVVDTGVSLYLDPSSWVQLLPQLAASPWRCMVVHESHRWITIGGQADAILRAIQGWGFTDVAYRRWFVTRSNGETFVTMQPGRISADMRSVCRCIEFVAENVDPNLTHGSACKLAAAAGVQAQMGGRRLKMQMVQVDAEKLRQRPICWNHTMLIRFTMATCAHTIERPIASTGVGHPTAALIPDRPATLHRNGTSASRSRGKKCHGRSQPKRRASGPRPKRLAMGDANSDTPLSNKSDFRLADDELERVPSDMSEADAGSVLPTIWEPGSYVLSCGEGNEGNTVLLQLKSQLDDGDWETSLEHEGLGENCRIEAAPRHAQGGGIVVRVPQRRLSNMHASKLFFFKSHGDEALSRAEDMASKLDCEIREWFMEQSIVRLSDTTPRDGGVPIYSLSKVRFLGTRPVAALGAALGDTSAADIRAEAKRRRRCITQIPESASVGIVERTGPPEPGGTLHQ